MTMPHRAPPPDEGIIRLKDEEPEPLDGDLYDGDVYEEGPSALRRWAVRLVVLAGLAAGGAVAATTWQTWLPKAESFGVGLVEKIDKRVNPPTPAPPSAEEAERQQREEALVTAAEALPYLAPEAIQLVMSGSLSGVLEPTEIFRRSQDALDRGRTVLPPAEAQELSALQDAVLAALDPAERNQVRIYESVRRTRVTLQFEDREALTLVTRGARALPPPSLERLRALSGKAIAAAPAGPEPTPAPAAEPSASS
jgi:hypothetical protein